MVYTCIIYRKDGMTTRFFGTEQEAVHCAELYFKPERIDELGIVDIQVTKTLKMWDCRDYGQHHKDTDDMALFVETRNLSPIAKAKFEEIAQQSDWSPSETATRLLENGLLNLEREERTEREKQNGARPTPQEQVKAFTDWRNSL